VNVHVATRLRSLDGLEDHSTLNFLEITECATITDLEPLRGLDRLALLVLEGRMYRPMRITSLRPLSRLRALRVLRLSAVRVADGDLSPPFGRSLGPWTRIEGSDA
jgi:hypothetical protein